MSGTGDLISGAEIIRRLSSYLMINPEEFVALRASRTRDPFELLVTVVLSQNTSDLNAMRAFDRLVKEVGTSAKRIAKTNVKKIERAIRPAGLHRVRARALRKLAKAVLRRYRGDFSWISQLDLDKARRRLMELPHVGRKTADVMLLFNANRSTFPIDTHIERISKRLGLVSSKSGYEGIRTKLMEVFEPNSYLYAHLLLIAHGRRTCRSQRPLCWNCVLADICDFPKANPQLLRPRGDQR